MGVVGLRKKVVRRLYKLRVTLVVLVALAAICAICKHGRTLWERKIERSPKPMGRPLGDDLWIYSYKPASSPFNLSWPHGELERQLHRLVTGIQVHCGTWRRAGNHGDGGWNVCHAAVFKPKQNCLVYSFGIGYDFSFDDDMAHQYGCLVRSFDPSMTDQEDHVRGDRVHFYKTGIHGYDYINMDDWPMKTLSSLRESFNESETIIDYLKIDVEGAEWNAFKAMFRDGDLGSVKQLAFELHRPMTIQSIENIRGLLQELKDRNFLVWHTRYNPVCYQWEPQIRRNVSLCIELHYLNMNFI